MSKRDVVRAAGALVWRWRHNPDDTSRPGRGELGERHIEVALVHRPRYDDWSWPKGKLDPGESTVEAAHREVWEETGLHVRLGIPLPGVDHDLPNGQTKSVTYWAAQPVGGSGELVNEIDELVWLTPVEAQHKLTYPRDVEPLRALVAAHERGELETWSLVFVRHSHAMARSAYRGKKDWHRPLSDRGKVRAKALIPVIAAWSPQTIVSSSSTRCVQTVKPYCKDSGARLLKTSAFTEETFEEKPKATSKRLAKLIKDASLVATQAWASNEPAPAVGLCTHRPLIPQMVSELAAYAPHGSAARRLLGGVRAHGMDKGEVLICDFAMHGNEPVLVSSQRCRTPHKQR